MAKLLRGMVLAAITLISGCGGGGGGGGSTPATPQTSFSVSTTSVSVSTPINRSAASGALSVTVKNPPDAGLYYRLSYTTNGIASGSVSATTSGVTLNIQIGFQSAAQLGIGTYTDLFRISVCYDSACNQHVSGSPNELSVQYSVTAPDATITTVASSVNLSAFITEKPALSGYLVISTANLSQNPGYYSVTSTTNGIDHIDTFGLSTPGFLSIYPKTPSTIGTGSYSDTITVTACWDAACTLPLANSPLSIAVTYTVNDTVSGSAGYTARVATNITANTFDVDPNTNTIYASTKSTSPSHVNSLIAVTPSTGAIANSVSIGIEPTVMDVSSDGIYGYVGFATSNQFQRYLLSTLTLQRSMSLGTDSSLGPLIAYDLQAAPNNSQTVAVLKSPAGGSWINMNIYDNTSLRTAYEDRTKSANTIRWGANDTQIFAGTSESSPTNLVELAVSSNITQTRATSGILSYDRFVYAGGLIYTGSGKVFNPVNQATLGTFGTSDTSLKQVAIDTALHRAYFLDHRSYSLNVYDLDSKQLLRFTAPVGAAPGYYSKLMRWGSDGLAYTDSDGRLIILQGKFVTE